MTPELWIILAVALIGLGKTFLNGRAIHKVHLSVNSRLDLALKETAQRAYLEGVRDSALALKELREELAVLKGLK